MMKTDVGTVVIRFIWGFLAGMLLFLFFRWRWFLERLAHEQPVGFLVLAAGVVGGNVWVLIGFRRGDE